MANFRQITEQDLNWAAAHLSLMRFNPLGEPSTRSALMQQLICICHDFERLEWLVRRALALFFDWPGVGEFRALYSSRWAPADGMRMYSVIYAATEGSDGYPAGDIEGGRLSLLLNPAPDRLQIEAPVLPPGDVSADPSLDRLAKVTAAERAMIEPRPEDYANAANEALYWMERGTGMQDNDVDRYRRELMSRVPQRKRPAPWPEGVTPVSAADIEQAEEQRRNGKAEES